MYSLRCLSSRRGGALLSGLVGLALGVALLALRPATATAQNSIDDFTINRVFCGISSVGNICVNASGSSTVGGAMWPRGTPDQYVFNSGLQMAGIIGADGGPWAGDTIAALMFNARGGGDGEQVAPIWNASDASAVANWPDEALVPTSGSSADLFNPLLRGRVSASQGDIWWMSGDGNPANAAVRPHPLGIVVEQRGMGWNYPTGNEDIIYFVFTFYNATSINPGTYASARPEIQDILVQAAEDFQSRSEAALGVEVPDGGYTINEFYAAFGADMDVADAGSNYASVHLPFALGYTYEHTFGQPAGWLFPPEIFSPPFFPGVGFVGVKYLSSPTGGGEIQLFSNTVNGGDFGDPDNSQQVFRYLSGGISPDAGDENCTYDPVDTHVCYINPNADDARFFQSSTPLTLAPGEYASIAVAYIFAAPVAVPGFVPGGDQKPGNPNLTDSVPALLADNVNMVDRLAGFAGYDDDNSDGVAQQSEFDVVPGSLLGKSITAQQIFDAGFLLPFAPEAPDFFLVPGDNQVTVLWRKSVSEDLGDPFFQLASSPFQADGVTPNLLYDPNYREFDVEGYRIYRGRVNNPNALQLVAQFDYAGTTMFDFGGRVNPDPACAPEIDIPVEPTAACPFTNYAPGVPAGAADTVPLVGEIIQASVRVPAAGTVIDTVMIIDTVKIDTVINPGPPVDTTITVSEADTSFQTITLNDAATVLVADTALTGGGNGFPALEDTGVPFAYLDTDVRNNFRYFYTVTAFDINSFISGPSSIESARVTKSVTPVPDASNFNSEGAVTATLLGRGTPLTNTALPTIDPAAGTFSGPFPPANGMDLQFVATLSRVMGSPAPFTATLDSLSLGSSYNGIPNEYYFSIEALGAVTQVTIPVTQDVFEVTNTGVSPAVSVAELDPELAARYGGSSNIPAAAQLAMSLPGNYYTSTFGRGCINGAPGFTVQAGCSYNGSRWFSGDNETMADPTANNGANGNTDVPANFNNAGQLPGVVTIYEARAYQTLPNVYRQVQGAFGGAARAADFKVYWGAGGVIDSVVDVTHNVLVPFRPYAAGSWGILNVSNSSAAGSVDEDPGTVTLADAACVAPFLNFTAVTGIYDCTATTPYQLSNTAVPGPLAFVGGPLFDDAGTEDDDSDDFLFVTPAANDGFLMWLAGHWYHFELEGGALPAEGTVWTMRSYAGGAISGGQGTGGDEGPYTYTQVGPLPFTAVGAQAQFSFNVTNEVVATTEADLDRVHTVPDPYYVTNEFEQTAENKVIKFVNLPQRAIIRIYSSSGVLVDLIEHNSSTFGGAATWNLRNRNEQVVASGVYFYHIESGDARKVGRFTIVNFAQ